MTRRPSLLAAVGLLLACAMADAPLEDGARTGRCEGGACPEYAYAVRVTPLSTSGFVVQDFNPVSGKSDRMDLTLRAPASLWGPVRIKEKGVVTDYAAGEFTVQARGMSTIIPGLAFDQPVSQTVRRGSEFALTVPEGIWDVGVTAADKQLPPVFYQQVVTAGESASPELVLTRDSLLQIDGFVVKQQDPWPEGQGPLFRLQAFDPSSGAPLSQALTTQGSSPFSLFALRPSGPVMLRLTPDPTNQDKAPGKEFLSDATGTFEGGFALGDYGAPVEVSGVVVDTSLNPIPGADLSFEGGVRGGGTFSASTRSGAGEQAGRFRVLLLPNRVSTSYRVTVRPPADSPFRSQQLYVAVGDAAVEVPLVECTPKPMLRGIVRGPSSPEPGPLADVLIHYEGLSGSPLAGTSKGDVTTGPDGSFAVAVEPGVYLLTAKPAARHRLPWELRKIEVREETSVELSIPPAREVIGALVARTADGGTRPVPNATVTVYRVPAASLAASAEDTAMRPLIQFEALSDDAGQFRLILPGDL